MSIKTKLLNDPDVQLLSRQPPKQKDFISLVQWMGEDKILKIDIDDWNEGHRLVPYGSNLFGVYDAPGFSVYDKFGHLNNDFKGNREEMEHPRMLIRFNKDEYLLANDKHKHYWEWKENRNKQRSVLEEQFGYDCYSEDTEFLTMNGWKIFDDVTEEDLIATFDQQSHALSYQKPIERIDGSYTGNMYHFTGHHTDCLVTGNHFMYIRPFSRTTKCSTNWELCRAAELPETFDTLVSINPKRNRQKLPDSFPLSFLDNMDILDFLRVIGWYISDGTMSFYENGKVKHMKISQSKPQSTLTKTLTKQRHSGKIHCYHYLYEKRGLSNYPENIWTFDANISQCIYDQCGHLSTKKRLPDWCYFLTKREMTTLLVALLQGDGSQRDHQNHTHVYYTVNHELASDVQRLALLCGFETSLYGPYKNNMCHVHINMRPKTRRTARSRVVKIPVINKRIVCFMVPNHTLVTRRNGHIGLHGNTKHAMHLVRLLRMGVESLRDGEIIVKRPDAEELLAIRDGAWDYDDIVKYAESMDKEVREVWYKKTELRKKPDLKFAARLLMDVQDLVWSQE